MGSRRLFDGDNRCFHESDASLLNFQLRLYELTDPDNPRRARVRFVLPSSILECFPQVVVETASRHLFPQTLVILRPQHPNRKLVAFCILGKAFGM